MKINKGDLIKRVIYSGASKEEFDFVQEDITKANNIISKIFSIVGMVLISAMFIQSFFVQVFEGARFVYLGGVICAIFVFVMSSLNTARSSLSSVIALYVAMSCFMIYGIVISMMSPERATVTFMVLMLLLAVIYIDVPLRMGFFIMFYVVVFIVLTSKYKNPEVRSLDITDALIYGFLSVASSYALVNIKVKNYVMKKQLKFMSEKDQLTGINNRNCYESKLDKYNGGYKNTIGCIYIDANGLHSLNNTKGHKAGDEMLQYYADRLKYLFGDLDTYRIGGDEFVAFVLDASEDYVKKGIETFCNSLADNGYHAAVGYSFSDSQELKLEEFVEIAEKNMYKNKAAYYENHER